MIPNTDANGIRYGYIAANNLDPDLVCELQNCGFDVHWHDFLTDMRDSLRGVIEDHIRSDRARELVENWVDDVAEHAADSWYDDEPIHEGTYEGVKYRTSWLGGALHVWIFESPVTGMYQECSLCVPKAGNLDCPDPDGVLTYDVPKEWRA